MSEQTVAIQLGVGGKPTMKEEVKAWTSELAGVVVSANQNPWREKYLLTHAGSGYALPQGAFKTVKAARNAARRLGREITVDWELDAASVVQQFNALSVADKKLYAAIMRGA